MNKIIVTLKSLNKLLYFLVTISKLAIDMQIVIVIENYYYNN